MWALPTIGWLMLCSAWSRSKPFLWAILIPVFSGILISWFNLMNVFHLDDGWFWKNIVARLLFGTVPGSWANAATFGHIDTSGPQAVNQARVQLSRLTPAVEARGPAREGQLPGGRLGATVG